MLPFAGAHGGHERGHLTEPPPQRDCGAPWVCAEDPQGGARPAAVPSEQDREVSRYVTEETMSFLLSLARCSH